MESRSGLTLIELLVILAIIAIFILVSIFAFKLQLMKGRDAKRKADLKKLQNILEDYLNDKNCYPNPIPDVCNTSVVPDLTRSYLSEILCDPIDNIHFNYFYSLDYGQACKSWYKIYTRLENEDDPIIEEIGCSGGCGPSNNYNYWVSSSNVTQVAQLPGEPWPEIPPLGPSPTPGGAPTATPTPGGPTPTPSPTPIPGGSTPTPTPTPWECFVDPACSVICGWLPFECRACCEEEPEKKKECVIVNSQPRCCYTADCN